MKKIIKNIIKNLKLRYDERKQEKLESRIGGINCGHNKHKYGEAVQHYKTKNPVRHCKNCSTYLTLKEDTY